MKKLFTILLTLFVQLFVFAQITFTAPNLNTTYMIDRDIFTVSFTNDASLNGMEFGVLRITDNGTSNNAYDITISGTTFTGSHTFQIKFTGTKYPASNVNVLEVSVFNSTITGKSANFKTIAYSTVPGIISTPITFSGVRVRGNVSRTQPVVTWPTLAGANTYCIRLSKDSTMASGVKTVCSLPGASYTVNATAPGARMEVDGEVWFYQVAGVDASGNQSPWSSNQTFLAVEITTSLEDESSSDIPVIYPNPFSDEINIEQTIGSYQVVDLLGNVLLSGTTPKVNTSVLASGLYYIKTAKKVYKIVKN